ncbi:MAG: hypothetical protein DRG82_10885 [Deltaproteobacteria bacterium]|nr:MAG: hypothetical protein DRG82_10885 [Deltaproteobacteria bacterium]
MKSVNEKKRVEFLVGGTILFFLALLYLSGCSLRPYRMKRAEVLYSKGQVLETKGHLDEALAKFNESMALAEKAGFQPGVANNLNEIAIIETTRGHYSRARELFRRALGIYEKMGWKPEVSKSLNNIALTYLKELDFNRAVEAYGELLAWDRKTGNRLGIVITLNNMGFIYGHYLGDMQKARLSYERALRIARQLDNQKYIKILQQKLKK